MLLGNIIHQFRLASHMTLEDVAKEIGVSKQTIQKYESGVISNIPSDKIEGMAKIFNCSPAALMGWEENKPTENSELDEENDRLFKNLPEDKKQQALAFLRFLQGK